MTVLMLLFPPFYAYVNRQLMSLGYGFILLPPWREFGERDATPAFVNVGLLFAQWFAVWIVAAVLYFEAALGSAVESGLSICFRHAHYVALLGQEAPP